MTDTLTAAHFRDETAARILIESIRWPSGAVCSHCGTFNHAYPLKKAGWYRCAERECRKDFTVTTGTVMERSHIPLHKWLTAFYLMNASKKGISAHQIHRQLGIKYQSAWFLCHRIREAMRAGGLMPLGGSGKIVEADETYYGRIPEAKQPKFKTRGRPFSKDPRGSWAQKGLAALFDRIDKVRGERNVYIHGVWGPGPTEGTAVVQTVKLDRTEWVRTELVTGADLKEVFEDIKSVSDELSMIAKDLGFLRGR